LPWLLNFIQKINFFPGVEGHYYLLYFVLITKFSDTGAYSTGSLIGRHKMIPRISPGKTWEGFVGALVVSTLASLVFVHFFGARMTGMNWKHAIILGLILAIGRRGGRFDRIALQARRPGSRTRGSSSPASGAFSTCWTVCCLMRPLCICISVIFDSREVIYDLRFTL